MTDERPQLVCKVARTKLVVSARWKEGAGKTARGVAEALGKRVVAVDDHREGTPVWAKAKLHDEVLRELSPSLVAGLGGERPGHDPRGRDHGVIRPARLQITNAAMQALCPTGRFALLDTKPSADGARPKLGLQDVHVLVYPLGVAAVILTIDLSPGRTDTLTEVRDALWRLRFLEAKVRGRRLGLRKAQTPAPREMQDVRTTPNTPSLGELCAWLLASELDEVAPFFELNASIAAMHDTVVVLGHRPDDVSLEAELFRLGRGYSGNQHPPPELTRDRTLWFRQGRVARVAREGSVALSWPVDDVQARFEFNDWPQRYLGVYAELALFARAEAEALRRISAEAAGHMARLERDGDVSAVKKLRAPLLETGMRMARYTVTLSSDDCGGLSDYADFFEAARAVHGVAAQRQELRAELTELLALVEIAYRDVAEKQRETEQNEERVFNKQIGIVSAVTIPFALVASVAGMNSFPFNGRDDFLVQTIIALAGVVLLGLYFRRHWPHDPEPEPKSNSPVGTDPA
jgi:hypothetical protein